MLAALILRLPMKRAIFMIVLLCAISASAYSAHILLPSAYHPTVSWDLPL